MKSHPFPSKTFHIGFVALLGLVLFPFIVSLLARDEQFDVEEEQFSSDATLMRRDDFSCSSGRPCHNGACCGTSGFCGYGKSHQQYTNIRSFWVPEDSTIQFMILHSLSDHTLFNLAPKTSRSVSILVYSWDNR